MPIRSHSTLAEVKEQFTKMGAALTAAATVTGITNQAHTITIPASADTNVDVIDATNARPGQLLVLTAAGAGTGDIILRDAAHSSNSTTGKNIKCGGATGSTVALNGANDAAVFIYSGSAWLALSSFEGGADQE
jgi:hypothetical protein